jgi:pseudo-rSAM protein
MKTKILFLPPELHEQIQKRLEHSDSAEMDDDIRNLIYRELMEGKSWLRIRNQAPCTECLYQWLCPSPSNYEIVTGKPNLCHI